MKTDRHTHKREHLELQLEVNLLNVGLPAAGFADSDSEAKRGMRVPVLEVNHDEGARSKNFKKCRPPSAPWQARCARRPSLHTGSGPGSAAVLNHHCRRPPLPVAPWPGPTGVWVHETCALRRCRRTGRRQGRGLWTARSESVRCQCALMEMIMAWGVAAVSSCHWQWPLQW